MSAPHDTRPPEGGRIEVIASLVRLQSAGYIDGFSVDGDNVEIRFNESWANEIRAHPELADALGDFAALLTLPVHNLN